MAHGTARSVATSVLGLIALQAVSTRGGSGRIASLLSDVSGLVDRVLDPKVPAIPDRRAPGRAPVTPGTGVRTGAAAAVAPGLAPGAWPSFNVPVPPVPR